MGEARALIVNFRPIFYSSVRQSMPPFEVAAKVAPFIMGGCGWRASCLMLRHGLTNLSFL